VVRPLECETLVPEAKVAAGFVVGRRFFLEFGRCEEAEDIEAVGRTDDNGADGRVRIAEEIRADCAVGCAEL